MKKSFLISIVVCLSIILTSSMAMAQTSEDVVVINPIRWDSTQTVYSNQTIVFDFGWAACKRGFIKTFLNANDLSFSMDGSPLFSSSAEASQYWGPVQQTPAPASAEACLGRTPETIWATYWMYTYGTLNAGDHMLHFTMSVDHPVLDGADYDGNGAPDIFSGTLQDLDLTIHVENP